MEMFDLGIAWNWEPDTDFVRELNDHAVARGLKPYIIHAYNFYTSLKDISEDNIGFRFFLDRTIIDPSPLSKVGDFLHRKGIAFINYQDKAKKLLRRSTAHHEPARHNILLPMRILIKPGEHMDTSNIKLSCMVRPFVLKPVDGPPDAESVQHATSLDDLSKLRERYGDITYVAQEKITPKKMGAKLASFRCVYCAGEVIPAWWHSEDNTHELLDHADMDRFELNHLLLISNQIANIAKLELFSVGIVVDDEDNFFVTDYLNIHPDMRRRSRFNKGLPDEAVDKVIDNIVKFVKNKVKA